MLYEVQVKLVVPPDTDVYHISDSTCVSMRNVMYMYRLVFFVVVFSSLIKRFVHLNKLHIDLRADSGLALLVPIDLRARNTERFFLKCMYAMYVLLEIHVCYQRA